MEQFMRINEADEIMKQFNEVAGINTSDPRLHLCVAVKIWLH